MARLDSTKNILTSARLARHLITLAVIFGLVSMTACGPGTETGNPVPTAQDAPNDGAGSTGGNGEPFADDAGCPFFVVQNIKHQQSGESALDEIFQRLCLRIFQCDPLNATLTCLASLNGPSGDLLLDELGLPEGLVDVSETQIGLQEGSIEINEMALASCLDDCLVINCNEVTTVIAPGNYLTMEEVVPLSCENTFSLSSAAESACN